MEHVEAFKQKVQELGIIVYFKSLIASDPGVCVQCHSPCDSEFCSPHCEMKYWDEFNHQYTYHSGKTPLCKFPRCFKTCYVENHGRVHDYCSKSHAGEHQKMKEVAQRQQHTSRNQRGKGNLWRGGHQLGGRGGGGAGTSQAGRCQQGHTRGGTNYSHCSDSHGTIYFYNRGEPYYEFTNFYNGAAFSLDDSEWPTTEHYFQAQKFVGTPYVRKIRNAFGPRDAFELSRNPAISRWRRSDWEVVKMDVMRKALFAKFTSHTFLKNKLLDTGKRELVERSPHDSYWGDGGDGTGENHLGRLLMELRAKLQGGQYKDVERDGMQAGTSCGVPSYNKLTRNPLRDNTQCKVEDEVEDMDYENTGFPTGSLVLLDDSNENASDYPPLPTHFNGKPLIPSPSPTPPTGTGADADAVGT